MKFYRLTLGPGGAGKKKSDGNLCQGLTLKRNEAVRELTRYIKIHILCKEIVRLWWKHYSFTKSLPQCEETLLVGKFQCNWAVPKKTCLYIYSTGRIIRDFFKIWHFSTKRLIKPISLIANGFILIQWYVLSIK